MKNSPEANELDGWMLLFIIYLLLNLLEHKEVTASISRSILFDRPQSSSLPLFSIFFCWVAKKSKVAYSLFLKYVVGSRLWCGHYYYNPLWVIVSTSTAESTAQLSTTKGRTAIPEIDRGNQSKSINFIISYWIIHWCHLIFRPVINSEL